MTTDELPRYRQCDLSGKGLLDLGAAAAFTHRTPKSLRSLYRRGLLEAAGMDDRGRLLFRLPDVAPLIEEGRPSELMEAAKQKPATPSHRMPIFTQKPPSAG